MGSPGQPNMGAPNLGEPNIGPPAPVAEERDSSRMIIVVAVLAVVAVMGGLAYLLRKPPEPAKLVSPYISSLKLSDFKMSAAENFIGATVSYLDGTITNSGNKTVTRVVVEVTFKDDTGQIAQQDPVQVQVVRNNGAYTEPVDMSIAPLAPGQSAPFRLTFERISAQWNRQYPEMRVMDVTVK